MSESSEKPGPDHLKPFQFKPGQTGNAGGRTKIEKHLRDLLKDDLDEIAKCMGKIARGKVPEGTTITAVTARDAIRAAEWVYDRCYGKPKQDVKIETDSATRKIPMGELTDEQLAVLALLDGGADGGPTEH